MRLDTRPFWSERTFMLPYVFFSRAIVKSLTGEDRSSSHEEAEEEWSDKNKMTNKLTNRSDSSDSRP